jgi:hypothetical protein
MGVGIDTPARSGGARHAHAAAIGAPGVVASARTQAPARRFLRDRRRRRARRQPIHENCCLSLLEQSMTTTSELSTLL